MALIPIENAIRVAGDRIVRVLRTHFADKVSEDAEAAGIDRQPAPERYHIFRGTSTDESALLNANVWVTVDTPTGFSAARTRGSAGPSRYCHLMETEYQVQLLFREVIQELPALVDRPDGTEPSEAERRQLNIELMQLRADAYVGSLMHTLLRYCQGGQAINDVEIVSGDSQLFQSARNDRLFGAVSVTISVTQKVGVPNKTPIS